MDIDCRLKEDDRDIIVENNGENKPLIIAFGGLAHQIAVPIFEFRKFMHSSFDCNFIFIKDKHRVWYFNGIYNFADDVDALASNLKHEVDNINPSTVITTGCSAGGFASILYGNLIGADASIAFSPQTYLDSYNRTKHKETRWSREIGNLHSVHPDGHEYFDLSNLSYTDNQSIDIFIGPNCKADYSHADKLSPFPNVNVTEISEAGHGCVRQLRDRGQLADIFKKHIQQDIK